MASAKRDDCEREFAQLKVLDSCITVRVIRDVGDFIYVVSAIHPELDVTFKFQIKESYPDEPPNVIIQSSCLQTTELTSHLEEIGNRMVGKAMLNEIVSQGIFWINENKSANIILPNKNGNNMATKPKIKQQKKHKAKDESISKKNPPMKTADDVVSRIMWDDQLPSEHFTVGYLDRFRGILEKGFTAFSWDNLASVDYTVLAIPKHRIQYFKYKSVKVWDKNAKLDNVFGSLGSGKTILDVMQTYDNSLENDQASMLDNNEKDYDTNVNFDRLHIDPAAEREEIEAYLGHCPEKLHPNYFICIRMNDESLLESVENFQESILQKEPAFTEYAIPSNLLHITICTLRLNKTEQLAEVCQALRDARNELMALVSPKLALTFQGLDHFHNRAMYVNVHDDDNRLFDITDTIKQVLKGVGIIIEDRQEFVPHMTVLKTSFNGTEKTRVEHVDPEIYSNFTEKLFGIQQVDAIHLCEISNNRQEDGFYMTPMSLPLVTVLD